MSIALFAWLEHFELGGMRDLIGVFPTEQDAVDRVVLEFEKFDYYQIVLLENMNEDYLSEYAQASDRLTISTSSIDLSKYRSCEITDAGFSKSSRVMLCPEHITSSGEKAVKQFVENIFNVRISKVSILD